MAKKEKQEKNNKKRISVVLYEDESEKVMDYFNIVDFTGKAIREKIGLSRTHGRKGMIQPIVQHVRNMTPQEREELSKTLGV